MPLKLTKTRLIGAGTIHALAVFLYIIGVTRLMEWFGRQHAAGSEFLTPIAFLMLFVLSTAVCAALIFGWPIVLWIQNSRREGLIFLASTIGGLLLLTVLSFVLLLTI